MRNRLALTDAGVPDFAERCGLGDRYRYWRDALGRRHLFTAVAAGTVEDFAEAVVVLAARHEGGFRGVAVLRPGDPGEPTASAVAGHAVEERLTVFVHLLAGSAAARTALAADLCGLSERLAA